ncbi:MAG: GumC family protein [Hyphococcus sp.]
MGDEFSLEDAIIILRRRFFYFLVPALIIAPLGILTVMLLPAKYTAQGTILVESQQIPTELVRSTINAYAQERIQTIKQRVMTRNRLLEVADKYDLFPRALGLSESERVALMRSRLSVSLITADFNRNTSRDGTIAFTVAYTDRDAGKAYQVANEFMTLFLSEDVRSRTTGASNTTEFFVREAQRLREAVALIEERISTYKTENADALPEHLNMHLDMLERANRDLESADSTITQLEEEERFLQTQLVAGPASDDSLAQELVRLQNELARLRATYRDSYPEVVAKRDEIAAIKRQMAPSEEIQALRETLAAAENELSRLERSEGLTPEALTEAEGNVEDARLALSEKIAEESRKGASDIAGVQLEGRLAVIANRIRMQKRQGEELRERIADLEARVTKTPEVERGLSALTRDYENIFREYQDVLAKQQDAQLAENLEENQQAEKFSILEPALRPEEPSSPDRPKLIVLALFAALAAGGGMALGVELLMSTVRGRNHLTSITDGHPIAVIPYIPSQEKRRFDLPVIGRLFGARGQASAA